MKSCIIPGSYDPITKGHENIILRASALFDTVYVAIMENGEKKTVFTSDERKKMAETVFEGKNNICVISSGGLLSELAKKLGVCAIVKGARDINDFVYENRLAVINKALNPSVETVIITAESEYTFVSSTAVRDIALHGGDVSGFVSESIAPIVVKKFGK